jgi:hypothetical protein
LTTVALASTLSSCSQRPVRGDSPSVSQEPGATTLRAQLQPTPGAPANALEQEDPELRRGYGIVDMRFEPCVTAKGDSALRGEACPAGFVIYGPYVNVPPNAEIEVTFEVESPQKVEVYADLVSQMGKQGLAALHPQVLEAGVVHKLGYRVNTFRPDPFVESRIGFRSATPVEFALTNYTMVVR